MIPRSAVTLAAFGAFSLATPASPAEAPAATVAVELSNFAFSPETIQLEHGRGYVLRLTNTGSGGHNFAASEFFAAAKVDSADRSRIKGGKIEVAKGVTVSIRFVAPAAGHYPVKCTHFLHSSFGMKGEIVVS